MQTKKDKKEEMPKRKKLIEKKLENDEYMTHPDPNDPGEVQGYPNEEDKDPEKYPYDDSK
jgi:hypothetical protein